MLLNISDLIVFFGRFHPLVVHLPIGILFLAAVMALLSRNKKFSNLAPALDFVLLTGAISAGVACVLGWMLSLGGDYDPDRLFWHQWMGILLAVLAFGIYWLRTRGQHYASGVWVKGNRYAFWFLLILIGFTGHLGGNLTHGSNYLWQYAPDFVRTIAGLEPRPIPRPPVTVLDSADIFLDAVHPLIQSKCQSCHNPDKQKGRLLLTNYEEMIQGGKNGSSVIPGDLDNSVLYQRIILPSTHEDYMPAEGRQGFNDDELALIKWWIEKGAPSSMLLGEMEKEDDIHSKLERMFGLNPSETRLPGAEVAVADSMGLKSVMDQGFIVKRIMPDANYLEIRLPFTGQTLKELDTDVLLLVKDQITWMDFSNGEVGDGDLEVIGQLKGLSRLNLANNPITDSGLEHLGDLTELTYLNLYGTGVSDEGLNALQSLNRLKSLYLWQTSVTDEGIRAFAAERPEVTIVMGHSEGGDGQEGEGEVPQEGA